MVEPERYRSADTSIPPLTPKIRGAGGAVESILNGIMLFPAEAGPPFTTATTDIL